MAMGKEEIESKVEEYLNSLEKLQDMICVWQVIDSIKKEKAEQKIIEIYNNFIKEDKDLRKEYKEYKKLKKLPETFWPTTFYFVRRNLKNLYTFLRSLYSLTKK